MGPGRPEALLAAEAFEDGAVNDGIDLRGIKV